jgi:hypothetical protein
MSLKFLLFTSKISFGTKYLENNISKGKAMNKYVVMCLFCLMVSGCSMIYSEPSTWTSPEGKIYQFHAELEQGTTSRRIHIYCNGEKIMAKAAHHWSKRLTMTTELDGKQVAAVCGGKDGARTCTIYVSGEEVAALKF